mmetsp:Transcript_14334/g.39667  ORF Transcript_14334/g.39667 Transcript_14334/m.39667 type:complete len:217 (-) Transcript_14334:915-1565(-)
MWRTDNGPKSPEARADATACLSESRHSSACPRTATLRPSAAESTSLASTSRPSSLARCRAMPPASARPKGTQWYASMRTAQRRRSCFGSQWAATPAIEHRTSQSSETSLHWARSKKTLSANKSQPMVKTTTGFWTCKPRRATKPREMPGQPHKSESTRRLEVEAVEADFAAVLSASSALRSSPTVSHRRSMLQASGLKNTTTETRRPPTSGIAGRP